MISDADKEWILKRLRKHHKTEDVGWEYELMEYGINQDKPSNIRDYVELQLKEKEYDEGLSRMGKEIFGIKIGDVKAADAMQKKLRQFIKKADKEVPGYAASRGRIISDIFGDILAIRTKGRVGSMRMVLKIGEEKMKKKAAKK